MATPGPGNSSRFRQIPADSRPGPDWGRAGCRADYGCSPSWVRMIDGLQPRRPDLCLQEIMTLNKRRLNPRDPFVVDTRDLGRRPGFMQHIQRDVPSPAGLGLDTIRVPDGAP